MRRKMTAAAISILAVIVFAFIIGLLLPEKRESAKQITFKSQPQKVFQTIADVENQASWRNDVQEIKMIDPETWTEVPKKGTPITFRTRRKIENQLFEIEIIAPKSFNGYWTGTFKPSKMNGTSVEFKEVIIVHNPFYRIISFLFIDLGQTMDLYVSNLKQKLGE